MSSELTLVETVVLPMRAGLVEVYVSYCSVTVMLHDFHGLHDFHVSLFHLSILQLHLRSQYRDTDLRLDGAAFTNVKVFLMSFQRVIWLSALYTISLVQLTATCSFL